MAWWNRLFKKKEPIQQEEDWEQLVYTRNGVNFDEEDQRKRYIVNCLEQIAEASKEIDLLTGEYTLVTSYLTDTDEIEALPAEQREEVNRVAGKLAEELLAAKFLQGIPLAGAVGGVLDSRLTARLLDYAALKYNRRFLLDHRPAGAVGL